MLYGLIISFVFYFIVLFLSSCNDSFLNKLLFSSLVFCSFLLLMFQYLFIDFIIILFFILFTFIIFIIILIIFGIYKIYNLFIDVSTLKVIVDFDKFTKNIEIDDKIEKIVLDLDYSLSALDVLLEEKENERDI